MHPCVHSVRAEAFLEMLWHVCMCVCVWGGGRLKSLLLSDKHRRKKYPSSTNSRHPTHLIKHRAPSNVYPSSHPVGKSEKEREGRISSACTHLHRALGCNGQHIMPVICSASGCSQALLCSHDCISTRQFTSACIVRVDRVPQIEWYNVNRILMFSKVHFKKGYFKWRWKTLAIINISPQLSRHCCCQTQQMTAIQHRARHAFRHKCNRTNATLYQILSVQVCCMRACNANALTLCMLRISSAASRAAFPRTFSAIIQKI